MSFEADAAGLITGCFEHLAAQTHFPWNLNSHH